MSDDGSAGNQVGAGPSSARLREIRDLLDRVVTHDLHFDVRAAAVTTIAAGWPDDPGTLAVLHRAARDLHGWVRAPAVTAIVRTFADHPDTLRLLHDALTDDSGQVRASAVTAIAQAFPDHPDTRPALHNALGDDDRNMTGDDDRQVGSTVRMAWIFPDDPGRRPRRLVVRFGQRSVRANAVTAIAQAYPAHPDTRALLHNALQDDDGYVRATAVTALAQMLPDDPGTLPALHRATRDGDHSVAGTAVRAITWRLPHQADTLAMLHDRATNAPADSYPRYEAQDLITDLRHGHAPRPPTDAELDVYWDDTTYAEDDMWLYQWVPSAIRRVWELPFDALYEKATADVDASVRVAALDRTAAGWPNRPETIPLLVRAAQHPDDKVRLAAVQGLGRVLHLEPDGPARAAWNRQPSWARNTTGGVEDP